MIEKFEQNLLTEKVQEKLSTPNQVTSFWREMLPGFNIPECDWTPQAIQRPMVDIEGNQVPKILVPVTDQLTLPVLGERYPQLKSKIVQEGTRVSDIHKTSGYVALYACLEAPNRNISWAEAEAHIERMHYQGGRVRNYILASQAFKELVGRYADQEEWPIRIVKLEGWVLCWLFGSRLQERVTGAHFYSDGTLGGGWSLGNEDKSYHPGGGWQFEEINKA